MSVPRFDAPSGLSAGRPLQLVLLLAGTVAVLAVLTGSTWLVLVAGALGGLVLQAVLRRPRLDRVRLAVDGPPRTTVGSTVRHRLRVQNAGPGTTPPLVVTHHLPGLPTAQVHVPAMPAGEVVQVEVNRPASRRAAGEGWATVATEDPLGLITRVGVVQGAGQVVVHPAPARPAPAALATAGGDGDRGPRSTPGGDLSGVREWRRGDGPRTVHWRSTARHGRLVVAEREVRSTGHLLLAVVGDPRSEDDERALAVAASTCTAALGRGDLVSLLAWSPPDGTGAVLVPSPGPGATAVLDWFAALSRTAVPDPGALVEAAVAAASTGPGARSTPGPAARPDVPVNVVVTASVPGTWWADLQVAASRRSVRVDGLR